MKMRFAILLIILLLTLTGCGGKAESPQPQGVSIARRGESLVELTLSGNDSAVTETSAVIDPQPTATASVTATFVPSETPPAPTATMETASTPEPTTLLTETAGPAEPAETAESPEVVCSPETDRQFGAEVIALVNASRKQAGLSALVEQAQLTQIARQHSQAMACEDFFGHITPEGLDTEARADQAGYPYTALGEVIAGGYASPEDAVESWLASSPHRAVLWDAAFTEVGVGYVYVPTSEYLYYWTLVLGSAE